MGPDRRTSTDATVITALIHYGLACYDGTHCVAALRDLGHEKFADVLADALAAKPVLDVIRPPARPV